MRIVFWPTPTDQKKEAATERPLSDKKQYYGNTPTIVKGEDIKGHEDKFDWAMVQQKPKDWKFMKESADVLRNIPVTWTAYPSDEGGRLDIIQMEFTELMQAKTSEARKKELVHLASACLHLWRYYEHIDD
jgi:hypothetical protein